MRPSMRPITSSQLALSSPPPPNIRWTLQPIMDVPFFIRKGMRTRGNRSNYRKIHADEMQVDEISLLQNACNAGSENEYKTIAFIFKFRHARLIVIIMVMMMMMMMMMIMTRHLFPFLLPHFLNLVAIISRTMTMTISTSACSSHSL